LKNPLNEGGASAISLTTRKGINVIDSNLRFGFAGFIGPGLSMSSGAVELDLSGVDSGSERAGELGTYMFTFSSSKAMPAGSQLRFVFPPGVGLDSVASSSCESVELNEFILEGQLS
jgi:hypothetical protein